MADSTVTDINKMKVVDLRKELKTRGLSSVGDKAELIARLTAAMVQDSNDEHGDGDINLDSDIDSDGVLEDEDDKSHGDILEDSAVDTLNEDLVLTEQPVNPGPAAEIKPLRTLKRKITASDTAKTDEDKTGDKDPPKKIVLNRTIIPLATTKPTEEKAEEKPAPPTERTESNKIKITADVDDSKSKMESRAKRFGLPVKMSEAERKEARMQRFGQSSVNSTTSSISSVPTGTLSENLDKLKKRAERFGQSVSKIMTDIEKKEKLEKRKAKFAAA